MTVITEGGGIIDSGATHMTFQKELLHIMSLAHQKKLSSVIGESLQCSRIWKFSIEHALQNQQLRCMMYCIPSMACESSSKKKF